MPRKSREYSLSDVYHVIFRGNDKQDIFYDDQDRYIFLDRMQITQDKFKYNIFSYCLMDNHVHMVIKVKDDLLSKSMHNLGIRYSMYFNKKMGRRGHLFENRYLSKKVENLDYFLNVCKYVHRNPENAKIEKTEKYKWSSYQDYIKNKQKIINPKVLLHYFNDDLDEFIKYTLEDNKNHLAKYAEYEIINKLNEDELIDIIKAKFDVENASDISLVNKYEREEIIKRLAYIDGTNVNQLARITKISRYEIKKIWENM